MNTTETAYNIPPDVVAEFRQAVDDLLTDSSRKKDTFSLNVRIIKHETQRNIF